MSVPAFSLRVPADAAFRGLAADVVGRYGELSGGTPAERDAVTAALNGAIDELDASPGEAVDLECTAGAAGLDVAVRSGGRSAAVHHPRPAEQR
jgi:hypothetical protein